MSEYRIDDQTCMHRRSCSWNRDDGEGTMPWLSGSGRTPIPPPSGEPHSSIKGLYIQPFPLCYLWPKRQNHTCHFCFFEKQRFHILLASIPYASRPRKALRTCGLQFLWLSETFSLYTCWHLEDSPILISLKYSPSGPPCWPCLLRLSSLPVQLIGLPFSSWPAILYIAAEGRF